MSWFGGLVTNEQRTSPVPHGGRLRIPAPCIVWTVGPWADNEVRMMVTRHRQVAVFGACSASDHDIRRLAEHGVSDAVLLAFAGSYTVIESTPDRTMVWTDVGHAWPIYTAMTPWGTVWGSSALALAALTGARPDPGWLAATLLAPNVSELTVGRSAFTGVSAVPPASCIVLQPGLPPHVLSRWHPRPSMVEMTEGASQLRRALGDAVAARTASSQHPSADCSGGLDSSSLTLLAAHHISDGRRLHAVTVHPAGITTGGDFDHARSAVRALSNITHLLCSLEHRHAPFSCMQELMPPTDEPAPTTIAVARAVAEFEVLREMGSDCHFTGDGGDTVLGGHPAYLADLARFRQTRLLMRHSIGWARLRRVPVWLVLSQALRTASTSRTAFLAALARELNDRGHRPRHRPSFRQPVLLSPAVWATPRARGLGAEAAWCAAGRDCLDETGELGVALTLKAIQAVGRTARADAQVAQHYGVRQHNPFTDSQVIATCLGVPTWQRHSPYRYKPLLTTALGDLLPYEIATRRTKGDFTPDHYLGLRANISVLHDLADGHLAALDLVDPLRLRQLLDHIHAGLPMTSSDYEPVLAAEVWLRSIATAEPAAQWQHSRASETAS